MSDYEFTQDWFHWAPELWEQIIPHLPARQEFLEIGSFEGRSTVWIVENMMEDGGSIDCIDTWEGGFDHTPEQMRGVEDRFDRNTDAVMSKFADDAGVHRQVLKYKGRSSTMLAEFISVAATPHYDFIYIDGSHIGKDVITDACMAWPLLKEHGVMVFDDYMWGRSAPNLHTPKLAIDFFTTLFAEELDITHIGYQLSVRKRSKYNASKA